MLLGPQKPPDGLNYNPCGGEKQQSGLNEGGYAFRFGVAIVVFLIGRLVAPAHGKPGNDGGAKIDQTVNGFR
jgi:hypothetical protein